MSGPTKGFGMARYPQQKPAERDYSQSILVACETLHMGNTGAYPDLTAERRAELMQFLYRRLSTWVPGTPHQGGEYDEAVRQLIKMTIDETNMRWS